MEYMTAKDIAKILGINPKTAKMRLLRARVQPIEYIGPTAIYDPAVIDLIREVSKGGRPRKNPK